VWNFSEWITPQVNFLQNNWLQICLSAYHLTNGDKQQEVCSTFEAWRLGKVLEKATQCKLLIFYWMQNSLRMILSCLHFRWWLLSIIRWTVTHTESKWWTGQCWWAHCNGRRVESWAGKGMHTMNIPINLPVCIDKVALLLNRIS